MQKYIRRIISLLLVLIISAKFSLGTKAGSFNQNEFTSPPERDQLPKLIDQFIKEREDGIAGLSLSVLDKDGLIYSKQYGYEDIENKVEVDGESVFEWGSVTKILIWISLFQLEEEGLIDLEEDIRTYLPDNYITKLSYPDEKVSVIDIMNHTAGFQEVQYNLETKNSDEVLSLAEALKYYEPRQI